jgi:uncharacterized protein (TIGR03437 family)
LNLSWKQIVSEIGGGGDPRCRIPKTENDKNPQRAIVCGHAAEFLAGAKAADIGHSFRGRVATDINRYRFPQARLRLMGTITISMRRRSMRRGTVWCLRASNDDMINVPGRSAFPYATVYSVLFGLCAHADPRPQLADCFGSLPLEFERNTGQTDSKVLFVTRSGTGLAALTADGIAFRLHGVRGDTLVKMTLKGNLNPKAFQNGEGQLPGRVNYLMGSDPSTWHTDVPTYSKVGYREIYPGIDLVFYGNQKQLEYDFVLVPGADPASIRFDFEGVTEVSVDPAGNLVGRTRGGSFELHKPTVYQESKGVRKAIEATFSLTHGRTVGFRLGTYDRSLPLVIDPVLVFSTFLGGSSADTANAVATDPAGNIYVAGVTQSADFPVTPSAFQRTQHANGQTTAFVSKLNPSGTALIYSTYLGGSSQETAYGLSVDSSGNAYVVGQTASKDFPTTAGALQTSLPASIRTSFVSKLNAAGNGLVYSTYLGGTSQVSYLCCDLAAGVAVDAMGNAYVAGTTVSAGFPVTTGAAQTKFAATLSSNAYVAKLNPSGTGLVYATFLGGSGQVQFSIGPAVFQGDQATAIAVDGAGNAYVAGLAHSLDFPVTTGSFQTRNKAATTSGTASQIPGYNAFVTKINPAGTAFVFSTYLGGSGLTIPNGGFGNEVIFGDLANAIAVDGAGNVYVTGAAYSADFPVTTGAYQGKLSAVQPISSPLNFAKLGYNAFVTKLNPGGTNLVYSTFVGGSSSDTAYGIAIDRSGNAYIAGTTTSLDFPVGSAAIQSANKAAITNSAGSAFVSQLNPTGTALVYSTFLGGSGLVTSAGQALGDVAYALTLNSAGNVYVAGTTRSADFPITQGAFQTTNNAASSKGQNAFVAVINPAASPGGDAPSIRPNLGVVDSASYRPTVTAGEVATIFGYGLASAVASAGAVPLSTSLGGTQVTIGGIGVPLLYVSPSQINLQIPWELAGQAQASVVVTTAVGSSTAATVNISAAAPAIFTVNASGNGQGAVVNVQGQTAAAATPVARGQYIQIYCLGLGAVSNRPSTGAAAVGASSPTLVTPTVAIGGLQVPASFAGLAPGFVGVYQVNALVPLGITPGSALPLSVSFSGAASQTVTIAVQ